MVVASLDSGPGELCYNLGQESQFSSEAKYTTVGKWKVKGGMGSPDWNVSMVDIHHRKLLWVY